MASVTRTIGPLHLEDLEPHRFEDMVRQLVYDFRNWKMLEATGRTGADKGFDARGTEIVSDNAVLIDDAEDEEIEADQIALSTPSERIWLIQCKREKSIGPTKLVTYLDEIPETERTTLYGIIYAAACDFSLEARERFREKVREFGLSEGLLWGKGELEDMLFQPKNDHLLFAYFGISLQTRRRSLKTQVRARLVMKRKASRILRNYQEVLLRSASDERYPYLDPDKSLQRHERGHWVVRKYLRSSWRGLHFLIRSHFAFVADDGESWDYSEKVNDAEPNEYVNPWIEKGRGEARAEALAIWEGLPETNRAWYNIERVLPYENIIDIDENGDDVCRQPHIYTTDFHFDYGPFRDYAFVTLRTSDDREAEPDDEHRVTKFPRSG